MICKRPVWVLMIWSLMLMGVAWSQPGGKSPAGERLDIRSEAYEWAPPRGQIKTLGEIRWEEAFDSLFPPDDWQLIDNDGSGSGWGYRTRVDFVSGFTILPEAGRWFLFSRFDHANSQGQIDEWVISPRLPAILSNDYLYFYAGAVDGQYPDSFYVYLSTSDSSLSSFNNLLGAFRVSGPGGSWHRYRFDMTPYAGTEPFVAVNYYHEQGGPGSPNSDNVWLDHFIIGELPDIFVTPDTVVFDTVAYGFADTLLLTLGNVGVDTLEVNNIVSSNPQFSVDTTRLVLPPNDDKHLAIYYTPDSLNPAQIGTFRIFSDDIVQEVLTVYLSVLGSGLTGIPAAAPPAQFTLAQNYPNPFNPETVISYQLSVVEEVELSIYNVLGQRIITLVDGRQEAGEHRVRWDGRDQEGRMVSSGIYYYRLTAGGFSESRKMILLR